MSAKNTGTVSETVSESTERAVDNCGGLTRVVIDFTGVFAILLELNRALQVAAQCPYQKRVVATVLNRKRFKKAV